MNSNLLNEQEQQHASALSGLAPTLSSKVGDALTNDGKITVSESEIILQEYTDQQNPKQSKPEFPSKTQNSNKMEKQGTANEQEKPNGVSKSQQTTPPIPFPLKNLVGQIAGTIYGVPIDSLSPRDKYNLEKGNYTEGIHKFTYTNMAGKTSDLEGRFYLQRGQNNTVEAKFLQVLPKPEITEWLQGGYKLKDGEKDILLSGETLSFTNKPLIKNPDGPNPIRSEKEQNYLAKLDDKTNQVIVRNMGAPKAFKFNTTIYSVEIPPADFASLKSGKSINIENPTFNGGEQKGTFSVRFDPVRNNLVVKKSEKIQESTGKEKSNKVKDTTQTKKTTMKPTQDIVKLSPKASKGPKI
ncbi:DUF3945 domain-containing protein [Pedobacter jeongneungensis]|uniref:DUF3945 domain-containing protein n=1 Tax=Pedobacter jeongneungensis TaxID=947309 RepID=UPI0004696539|nr:DUF3945 domain-containing protein [Pedobacter jeongneungensis]